MTGKYDGMQKVLTQFLFFKNIWHQLSDAVISTNLEDKGVSKSVHNCQLFL